MKLSEDEKNKEYAKHCGHYSRNTLLPYEDERNCVSCGFNTIKGKHKLTNIQRKK